MDNKSVFVCVFNLSKNNDGIVIIKMCDKFHTTCDFRIN